AGIILAEGSQRPQRRADPEPYPAAAGLVEGAGLHGDDRGVAPERIDDADTDPEPAGAGRDLRGDGEDPAAVAALGQPYLGQAQLLGRLGQLQGFGDRDL